MLVLHHPVLPGLALTQLYTVIVCWALMFAIFLGPHPSIQVAVLTGCAAGLVWIATGLARNHRSNVPKGRGLELCLINGGFHAVQFMVLGLVFANFQ